MNNLNKIMLGTAQFGMRYGIANQDGQVHEKEITKILKLAESQQINMIDTASQYGTSETLLGKLCNPHFKIITKLRPLPLDRISTNDFVIKEINSSLESLKKESIDGLLIHHADDLLKPEGMELYTSLMELKLAKKVKKIGVSIYSPEQAYALVDRYDLDIIQFPFNILDQRFLQDNLLSQLKEKNIELHVRSVFLQGLLLMNPESVPEYFNKIKTLLVSLNEDCKTLGLTIRQALIDFVLSKPEINHCIFGVDNHTQLNEIINDCLSFGTINRIDHQKYICQDIDIINPMNWKIP